MSNESKAALLSLVSVAVALAFLSQRSRGMSVTPRSSTSTEYEVRASPALMVKTATATLPPPPPTFVAPVIVTARPRKNPLGTESQAIEFVQSKVASPGRSFPECYARWTTSRAIDELTSADFLPTPSSTEEAVEANFPLWIVGCRSSTLISSQELDALAGMPAYAADAEDDVSVPDSYQFYVVLDFYGRFQQGGAVDMVNALGTPWPIHVWALDDGLKTLLKLPPAPTPMPVKTTP